MSERPPASYVPRFQRFVTERPSAPFVPQFQLQYHATLTYDACPENSTIQEQLLTIVAANLATDLNQFESAPGPNAGSTLFALACAAALRASQVQFARLEAVIGPSAGEIA